MRLEQRALHLVTMASILFTAGCEAIGSPMTGRTPKDPEAITEPLPASSTPPEGDSSPTVTPFLPFTETPTVQALRMTPTPTWEPYVLSLDSPVRLDKKIETTVTFVIDGNPVAVAFTPNGFEPGIDDFKDLCPVGTTNGCTFSDGDRTFVFLDSGWFDGKKLPMEALRAYFEGTGVMRSAEERGNRLTGIEHTAVTVLQDGEHWTGEILAALYIPHDEVDAFTYDITAGPDVAARLYPGSADALARGKVFIEFCGWDPTLPGNEKYTASRYLIVVGDPGMP